VCVCVWCLCVCVRVCVLLPDDLTSLKRELSKPKIYIYKRIQEAILLEKDLTLLKDELSPKLGGKRQRAQILQASIK